jgi:hypothetical protein
MDTAPSGEGTTAADRGHMQRIANLEVLQMKYATTNNQRWQLLTMLVLPIACLPALKRLL